MPVSSGAWSHAGRLWQSQCTYAEEGGLGLSLNVSSPLKQFFTHYMCTDVPLTCMSVHHVCAWCPQRSDEGIRFHLSFWARVTLLQVMSSSSAHFPLDFLLIYSPSFYILYCDYVSIVIILNFIKSNHIVHHLLTLHKTPLQASPLRHDFDRCIMSHCVTVHPLVFFLKGIWDFSSITSTYHLYET